MHYSLLKIHNDVVGRYTGTTVVKSHVAIDEPTPDPVCDGYFVVCSNFWAGSTQISMARATE
jgi:hypothetical protein